METAIFIRTGMPTDKVISILNKHTTQPIKVYDEFGDWITLIVDKKINWDDVCAKEKIAYFGSREI